MAKISNNDNDFFEENEDLDSHQEELEEPHIIDISKEKKEDASDLKNGKESKIKSSPFVHLHIHTEYSCLDGGCKIDELCRKAKEYGMPSLTITDHGNMFGVVQFFKIVEKNKLKPIIGIELYLSPTSRFDRQMPEK